jgi:hypothetical protein
MRWGRTFHKDAVPSRVQPIQPTQIERGTKCEPKEFVYSRNSATLHIYTDVRYLQLLAAKPAMIERRFLFVYEFKVYFITGQKGQTIVNISLIADEAH